MPIDDAADILDAPQDDPGEAVDYGPGVDIVPPEGLPRVKGKDHRVLQIERERRQVAKQIKIRKCAELVAVRKLSFRETADEMGISYQHVVHTLWPEAKLLTAADMMDPAEKERVAMMISDTIQQVIRTAAEKMDEHAAYGMVALNGCKQLAEMHGIDFKGAEGAAGAIATIEEVAQSVLEHAPLLASNLEKIQRIKDRQRIAIEEGKLSKKD